MRPMTDPKPIPWSRPDAPLTFVNPNQQAFTRVVDGYPLNGVTMG